MTDEQQRHERQEPAATADVESVEQVVRGQLSKALGGRRGHGRGRGADARVHGRSGSPPATCAPPWS